MKSRESVKQGSRLLLYISAAILGTLILWFFLSFILGTERGFDLTDEGLYLLAADPPSPRAAWGFPFGWHTGPLFALVGYDLSAFRTLGAFIMVMATGWLGWATARTLSWRRGKQEVWVLVGLTITGAVVSLTYYTSMLRTPSYNWLNLVTLTLAAAATFSALAKFRAGNQFLKGTNGLWWAFPASLALCFSIPAKPSTLPIFMAISGLAVFWVGGRWIALKWIGLLVALVPIWIGLFVVVGLWPTSFITVFQLALQMPTGDSQTFIGGLQGALLLPKDALAAAWNLSPQIKLTALLALALLAIPVISRRRLFSMRIAGLVLGFIAALATAGMPIPLLNPLGEGIIGWANRGLVTASFILLFLAFLSSYRLEGQGPGSTNPDRKIWTTVVVVLILLPFVYSFGSSNGAYPQAAGASGFILLAAAFIVLKEGVTRDTALLVWVVGFLGAVMVGAGLIGGWHSPYRDQSLFTQVVPIEIGRSATEIYLSPQKSAEMLNLRNQAESLGWQAGTPLIDVSYPWHPGLPYFLGATVPSSLMLTLFGSEASQPIVDFHLTQPYRGFPFEDAWILTSKESSLSESSQLMVSKAVASLEKATGRPFPEAYSCVSAGDFVLYRPEFVAASRAESVNCRE